MSDKSSVLKAFNTHFFAFVDDIINIFPENEGVRSSKTSFEFFKKANPTCLLKAWNYFVSIPYRQVIEEGKLDFFFDKDYKEDLAYLSSASTNEIMAIIDTLRGPVKEMSDVNRAHSMKYIQNLSKRSDMYMAFK